MTASKITQKFYLFSLLSITAFVALTTVILIIGQTASDNITISRGYIKLLSWLYNTFGLLSVVAPICSIIYAHAYFGKKTSLIILFSSLGIILLSKIAEAIYAMIINNFDKDINSAIIKSYLIEYAIYIPVILVSLGMADFFAISRCKNAMKKRKSLRSPMACSIMTVCLYALCFYFIIPCIDLVFEFIIPQLDRIRPEDIPIVILDFVYIFIDFVVILLLGGALAFGYTKLTTLITGKLKAKQHYKISN